MVGVVLLGLIVCSGYSQLSLEAVAMGSSGACCQGELGWSVNVIGSGEMDIQSGCCCCDFDVCRCNSRMVEGGIDGLCCVWLVGWAWIYAPAKVGMKVFDDLDVVFNNCLDVFKK